MLWGREGSWLGCSCRSIKRVVMCAGCHRFVLESSYITGTVLDIDGGASVRP